MSIPWTYFGQQLINGLTLGFVYGLIAVGYTMVYGIIGMINFAHGEIYMIGAFLSVISIVLLGSLGVTFLPVVLLVTLIAAVVLTSFYGWTIERVAYRPLRKSFRLAPLISAIGMSIFLQNIVQLLQGARVKAVPPLVSGSVTVWDGGDNISITISTVQLLIMGVTLAAMVGLTVLIRYTTFGRAQRACAQDKTMAALLGIDVDRTIALTFVVGAALAAVAGLMVSLYYGVIDFFIGFLAGIKAFAAAVLGGIGSLPGAMLGGILIGLIEAMWSSLSVMAPKLEASSPMLANLIGNLFVTDNKDIAAFAVLVLILLFRPSGLLGKPDIEKV